MRESFARDDLARTRPVSVGTPGGGAPRSHAASSAREARAIRRRIDNLRVDRVSLTVTLGADGPAVSARNLHQPGHDSKCFFLDGAQMQSGDARTKASPQCFAA